MPRITHAGLFKRCGHASRTWPSCPDPWWFRFHHAGTEHRFSLHKEEQKPAGYVMDKAQPIYDVRSMRRLIVEDLGGTYLFTGMLGVFAIVALLLAAAGVYGLVSFSVSQRAREIGVRMALGAEPRDVLRLVLTRALRIVVAGVIVGLAGAAGVTRVLQTFLFGVTPTDPIAFTIVTLLLMAVGLMAAWLPARRATRIDPCAALRAE